MMCDCPLCRLRRAMLWPEESPAAVRLGGDEISRYMLANNVSFPEAVEAISDVRRREMTDLAEVYASRHGLNEQQTVDALWAHGIDGPGVMQ